MIFSIWVILFHQQIINYNIAIGIWSGKENFGNRLLAQAKTWMRFWKEVYVFTDFVPENGCEKLNIEASPCIVKCVPLGNRAEHLEGTEWVHRWYHAQPRFLPAMASLYEHNPNASWYLFGDDDTYFFSRPIQERSLTLNPNSKSGYGKLWTSWARIVEYVPPIIPTHIFAQGGAGVFLSNALMKELSPNLENCSAFFNDPDFAGSMRFALCAERTFGVEQWTHMVESWAHLFHSDPPETEIKDGNIQEPPYSFHRIQSPQYEKVSFSQIGKQTLPNGSKKYFDFSSFSYTKHDIFLGNIHNRLNWWFGFRITLQNHIEPIVTPTSLFNVVNDKFGNVNGFFQTYTNNVVVNLECDDNIPPGKVLFSHFSDTKGLKPVLLLSCQNISSVISLVSK